MSELIEVPRTTAQTALSATPTPSDLLRLAIDKGADLDRLERLMDLQAKYEAGQARKAFTAAMTELKSRNLTVRKDKSVAFSGTAYTHSSLAEVVETVVRHMADAGLSHRWTVAQEGKSITVACVITHELGHSEQVVMTAAPDDSGKKNAIQQVASTITYLQRYTLMAACGLASRDMPDDDGRGSEHEQRRERGDGTSSEFHSKVKSEHWVGKMAGAETLEDLAKARADSEIAYGDIKNVPPAVRSAFSARKAAIVAAAAATEGESA